MIGDEIFGAPRDELDELRRNLDQMTAEVMAMQATIDELICIVQDYAEAEYYQELWDRGEIQAVPVYGSPRRFKMIEIDDE